MGIIRVILFVAVYITLARAAPQFDGSGDGNEIFPTSSRLDILTDDEDILEFSMNSSTKEASLTSFILCFLLIYA